MVGPTRPLFVLFGLSIVQFNFSSGGWGAILSMSTPVEYVFGDPLCSFCSLLFYLVRILQLELNFAVGVSKYKFWCWDFQDIMFFHFIFLPLSHGSRARSRRASPSIIFQ